ncbi:MAG: MG2 domain-containing protein [Nitrospinales bacterium]
MKRFFISPHIIFLALACVLIQFLFAATVIATSNQYSKLKSEAEKFFSEASFSRAHEIYKEADKLELNSKDARWVDFRVADTLWRSQAGSRTSDTSKFDKARQDLEVLIRDIKRVEDRDIIWAEVKESLGDFWWTRNNSKNWGSGWSHYQMALDWWAGQKNIDFARDRYLSIVWRIASPPWRQPYYYYGYHGNMVPQQVLENVLKIAVKEEDKLNAHYLMAMTLRNNGGWNQQARAEEEFQAAMKAGKSSEWYDDALFNYAEWIANRGQVIIQEDGRQTRKQNYPKALELYRKILKIYSKGETRYYKQAKNRIENITRPVLGLNVSNTFLPGSQIQAHLNWRNIDSASLSLYPVDLTRDVRFTGKQNVNSWIKQLNPLLKEKLHSWTEKLDSVEPYKPGSKSLHIKSKVQPGAYVLVATGGGKESRQLILVTDTAIVLKSAKDKALVYFSSVYDGSPVPNARVKLYEKYYDGGKWNWKSTVTNTNKDGLALFKLKKVANNSNLFASAIADDRQAFSTGYNRNYGNRSQPWKVYVFTDRPAYRPNETAEWKVIARTYDGSVYGLPSNETIEYQINDPRGTKLKEGKLKLNEFGSAWDSVKLGETIPLGAYQITFWNKGRKKHIGNASLFRLEEYKLPEFKVSVKTPEENEKKKTFRLGDTVQVDIEAEYFFGAPVANANVEVVVHQKPFYHYWRPSPEFPWYYEDLHRRPNNYYGNGQQIKREVIKTDASGKARLTFDSNRSGQDLEYRIEARVTDASRREVRTSGSVRVTQKGYFAYINAEHNLYRPQNKAKINIKTMDANEQPVEVQGKVKVTRDYWFEIWLDPNGKEVKGDQLQILKAKGSIFPPPLPFPGNSGWKLKFRGYQHDEILTQTVKTNSKGEAEFTFVPAQEGYYRIAWTSKDEGRQPITAETTIWSANPETSNLGYHHGGVEIILDKDTFRAGEKAPVMLSVPVSNQYVLFSIAGDDLYSYQLVHLSGTVKLLQLDIEEKHVPNIFLQADMIRDMQFYQNVKQVVVPPTKNFLNVTVESDQDQYQPQDRGIITVTATDNNGKPAKAEIALGLVDESVYQIQSELAGDPRKFFFGSKRQNITLTQSTFQQKRYIKLVKGEKGQLMDDKLAQIRKQDLSFKDERDYSEDRDGVSSLEARAEGNASSGSGAFGMAGGKRMMAKSSAPMAMMEADAVAPADNNRQAGSADSAVQVRSDFRTTALWLPSILTGKDGKARVQVKYPDSVTQWRATARVVSRKNQFGISTGKSHTQKPLIVRLQAPRFFVVGDSLTLSAIINNNTNETMNVTPSLEAEGITINAKARSINIPAHSEERIDWTAMVTQPGRAKIKVLAFAKNHSDAMEKNFIVHEHGIEKFIAKSGKLRSDDFTVHLDIPNERKADSTSLTVDIAPSMAVTMMDALPYLIDFPYGCTEQTMSRFLPAVITAKTLSDLGQSPQSLANKIFGGIDPEMTSKTHHKGKKDLSQLNDMVEKGLNRLYDFQHSDGGWGWWKKGNSDHFMSAYVLWGLVLAKQAGKEINSSVVDRAYNFLNNELVDEENNYDQQAWMLHALSSYHADRKFRAPHKYQAKALDNLWKNRTQLNAYTRALLALSAKNYGDLDKAKVLARNLEDGVVMDNRPDTSIVQRGKQKSHDAVLRTAHWGEDGLYWRWSNGGVESTAFVLRALLAINPESKLIEPATNWLIKNRRGSHWSNTRDTAITILAMNDYLKVSGELESDLEYELMVNGKSIAKTKVKDVLSAPSRYTINSKLIGKDGADVRIIRRGGDGPIYFSAQATFFSLEDPIPPAGNEIFLRRQYYKLVGNPTLLKGYVYDKVPLNEGDIVTSGDRVETVITIETKNNYEYLLVEDLKPAGLEAVQIKSGEALYARELKSSSLSRKLPKKHSSKISAFAANGKRRPIFAPRIPSNGSSDFTGRSQWVYQEMRDRKSALFIDKLPQGVWEIRYTMRAEVPGKFHALPVKGHAMYIPEIRANGAEIRFEVKDKE